MYMMYLNYKASVLMFQVKYCNILGNSPARHNET